VTLGNTRQAEPRGRMPRIICLGAVVYDQVFIVPTIPARPEKVLASAHRTSGGGMAVTAAIAASALGASVRFWGRVGADVGGEALRRMITEAGVDVSSLRVAPGGQTATSGILIDGAGERLLAAYPGSGLGDDPSWLPLDLIAEAQAVLVDVRWPQGATATLTAARRCGVPSVLDAELAPPATLLDLCGLADHAIFSERALRELTGLDDHAGALAAAARHTPAQLGVTLGAQGSLLYRDGELSRVPAYAVPVVDTNGAGDVFHGAYAVAIAEGVDPLGAMRFASAAAAMKCARGAGWSGMPARSDVDRLMKSEQHADITR
jgi:sulfofructose kinase